MTASEHTELLPARRAVIAHDGFAGDIIGHYVTREGKRGVVIQQDGTRVVHVYGEKWLPETQHAALPDGAEPVPVATLQERVAPWMQACFGPEISADKLERSDRFMEEALELVQASAYPKERVYALVEYVYGRDQGEINQEVGGVMITLAAHCLAHGVDMHAAGETELARIWTKVEKIRAKQAAKPTGSALPVAYPAPTFASPSGMGVTEE